MQFGQGWLISEHLLLVSVRQRFPLSSQPQPFLLEAGDSFPPCRMWRKTSAPLGSRGLEAGLYRLLLWIWQSVDLGRGVEDDEGTSGNIVLDRGPMGHGFGDSNSSA